MLIVFALMAARTPLAAGPVDSPFLAENEKAIRLAFGQPPAPAGPAPDQSMHHAHTGVPVLDARQRQSHRDPPV
jgi:hypothetical protein